MVVTMLMIDLSPDRWTEWWSRCVAWETVVANKSFLLLFFFHFLYFYVASSVVFEEKKLASVHEREEMDRGTKC